MESTGSTSVSSTTSSPPPAAPNRKRLTRQNAFILTPPFLPDLPLSAAIDRSRTVMPLRSTILPTNTPKIKRQRLTPRISTSGEGVILVFHHWMTDLPGTLKENLMPVFSQIQLTERDAPMKLESKLATGLRSKVLILDEIFNLCDALDFLWEGKWKKLFTQSGSRRLVDVLRQQLIIGITTGLTVAQLTRLNSTLNLPFIVQAHNDVERKNADQALLQALRPVVVTSLLPELSLDQLTGMLSQSPYKTNPEWVDLLTNDIALKSSAVATQELEG